MHFPPGPPDTPGPTRLPGLPPAPRCSVRILGANRRSAAGTTTKPGHLRRTATTYAKRLDAQKRSTHLLA